MPSHHAPSIPKSIHYTEEAASYHEDRCVSRTMARMADPEHCIAYMAGVAEGNPEMAGVSIADLRAHCASKEATFTVADAEELCKGLNDAHASFWSDKGGDAGEGCCRPVLLGTTTCAWTARQIEALGERAGEVDVVMCDQEKDDPRCADLESVPTWHFCDGTTEAGFRPLSQLPL